MKWYWERDRERWRDRTCDRDRFTVWTTCTGETGSKGAFEQSQEYLENQETGSCAHDQGCLLKHHRRQKRVRQDRFHTGADVDRWTGVRHAACASASLRGWRSLGVRPRSVGVRTDPGQAGAGGTAVPVSMPVWGRWNLCHGGLLGVGTFICTNQPQPSHHLPVSNTFPGCVILSCFTFSPFTSGLSLCVTVVFLVFISHLESFYSQT